MPEHANAGQTWIKGEPSPYQLRELTHFPDWRKLIVLDAFFNNLASALMVVSALLWWFGPPACASLLPIAMTLALALVCIDLALLVFDLGDPWRFSHSLRVMRFTSPLSVGVWGLVSYSGFLGCAVILQWILWHSGGGIYLGLLARLFTVMAILGALVVLCYKGVVFSCTSQPGLRDARWLTPFVVADSLLMGIALYLLVAMFFMGRMTALLVMPLAFLIVARCLTFTLLWQDVKVRARKVYREENCVIGITVFIVAGLIPLFLPLCGIWGLVLASILVLASGLFERAWIIGLARPI